MVNSAHEHSLCVLQDCLVLHSTVSGVRWRIYLKGTPGPRGNATGEAPFVPKEVCTELPSQGSFLPRYLSWARLHEHHHCALTPLHNMTPPDWQLKLSLGEASIQHTALNVGMTISTPGSGERAVAMNVTWRQPWQQSFTPWRHAKVRATPWTIQDSIQSALQERKGNLSTWKMPKELGFLKCLLRSCVGSRNVLSISPSVFVSVK